MIRSEIIKLIFVSLLQLRKRDKFRKIRIEEINLEHPRQEKFGDWSTNVAMLFGPQLEMSPLEFGQKLVEIMNKEIVQHDLEKIALLKPGFINFYLSKEYYQKELARLLQQKEDYGKLKKIKRKKVMVEFISANPTGPLTLGNARGGFLGDSLARILEWNGAKVIREYYFNDAGKQIEALGHSVLRDGKGAYQGEYIDKLHQRIAQKDPQEAGFEACLIILEENIKKTVKRMNIHFDEWFSERALHHKGFVRKTIEQLQSKGYIKEGEGATWFKASAFSDDQNREMKDCVLIKKDGKFTYLAGDIAYHANKFYKRRFDQVINIWGADHHGDVPRLKAGLEALGVDVKERLKIIIVQFVRLVENGQKVRMSKRRGCYVTVDELLDEIGLDVARFFFLMHDPDSQMDFDLQLARDRSEKNPVFYVQYAYARIASILRKAKQTSTEDSDFILLQDPAELSLLKHLVRFPEVVKRAGSEQFNYEVHKLPYYAISLAEKFHRFYKRCRVIGEDQGLTRARLGLVHGTRIVLKNILDLLGVSAPEKM